LTALYLKHGLSLFWCLHRGHRNAHFTATSFPPPPRRLYSQWECKADLNNDIRFGETTVVCEGYDYPDDPFVLVGSCGVEYTLERAG
jgi:hypothetical protein